MIVPDRELYYSLFASAKCSDNSPLIFKYTLSVCPSIEMITAPQFNRENNDVIPSETSFTAKTLIIGDPHTNLTFANREAEKLKRFFEEISAGQKPTILVGSDATKENIKSELIKSHIVHIASHANSNTDDYHVVSGSINLSGI